MKKALFLAVMFMGVMMTVNAQESPLKAYIGKYTFAAGSPVAEVTITLEDTALIVNSAMGSTAIEKKGTDTFYLAQYDASVVFKRDASNVVTEVAIMVQGMELVGKKEAVPSVATKEELFFLN
jgi:hypothetical protein